MQKLRGLEGACPFYDNEESASLYLLRCYVGGIGSNAFENTNGICDVEVLS